MTPGPQMTQMTQMKMTGRSRRGRARKQSCAWGAVYFRLSHGCRRPRPRSRVAADAVALRSLPDFRGRERRGHDAADGRGAGRQLRLHHVASSMAVMALVVVGATFGALLVALLSPVGSRSGVPSMIAARAPLGPLRRRARGGAPLRHQLRVDCGEQHDRGVGLRAGDGRPRGDAHAGRPASAWSRRPWSRGARGPWATRTASPCRSWRSPAASSRGRPSRTRRLGARGRRAPGQPAGAVGPRRRSSATRCRGC